MTTHTNVPRYRTTLPMTFLPAPYLPGSVVTHQGWPLPEFGLEPINEIATKIASYFRRQQLEPFLPQSPIDHRSGKVYLAGALPSIRGRGFPPAVPQGAEHPAMPLYKMLSEKAEFAGRHIPLGEKFAFLSWPERMHAEPANSSAAAVIEYFEAHKDNAHLPPSPWNEFDNSLWLPVLPQQVRPTARHDRVYRAPDLVA